MTHGTLGETRWRILPLPRPLWLWVTADVLDDDSPPCTVYALEVHEDGAVYAVASIQGCQIVDQGLLRSLGAEALRVSGLSRLVSPRSRAGRLRIPFPRRG